MNKQIFTKRVAAGVIYGSAWHDENWTCTSFFGSILGLCKLYRENGDENPFFHLLRLKIIRNNGNYLSTRYKTQTIANGFVRDNSQLSTLIWKESRRVQLSHQLRDLLSPAFLIFTINQMNFKIFLTVIKRIWKTNSIVLSVYKYAILGAIQGIS